MSDEIKEPLEGEVIPADQPTFDISVAPHPLRGRVIQGVVAEGATLRDLGAGNGVLAFVDGERVDDLDHKPRAGQNVLLKTVPMGEGGGKTALRVVAAIAIVALSYGAGSALVGAYGAAAAGAEAATFGGLTAAGWGAAFSAVGMLAFNALVPPPSPGLDLPTPLEPFRSIARTNNRIAPFDPVPKVCGKFRVYPCYAMRPTPTGDGGVDTLNALFCVGYRPLKIDPASFRLGETLLSNYSDVEYEIVDGSGDPGHNGANDDGKISLFPTNVVAEALNAPLEVGYPTPDSVLHTTPLATKKVEIEIAAAPLLYINGGAGTPPSTLVVGFKFEISPAGANTWTRVRPTASANTDGGDVDHYPQGVYGGVFPIAPPDDSLDYGSAGFLRGSDYKRYFGTFSLDFPSVGQWDVRITRLPWMALRTTGNLYREDGDTGNVEAHAGNQDNDFLSAVRFRSILDEDFALNENYAYIALKIKATDQLSGVVDDFNLEAQSILEVWNGSAYELQPTSNPAWIYRDILLGTANARPVSASRLDENGLQAWGADCDAAEREFNGLFDGSTTVFEALKSVASAGRASPSIRDGKYSVVQDKPGLVPVQLFTPRNMWGFSGSKSYLRLPHALRVKFHDASGGWQESEIVVYDDGYSADGTACLVAGDGGSCDPATRFETVSLFGVTRSDQAHRDARYHIAQARLRPETFSWNCDIDNLVCQRGDVVRVQHDAVLLGLGAGRIKSIVTNYLGQSEDFSNAYWTHTNSQTLADKLVENTANGGHYINRTSPAFAIGQQAVVSINAAELPTNTHKRYFSLIVTGVIPFANVNQIVEFDLANGSVVRQDGGATGYVEKQPDGTYRCTMITSAAVAAGTGGLQFRISDRTTTGAPSYTGDGISGFAIADAQFEMGTGLTVSSPYAPNTSGAAQTSVVLDEQFAVESGKTYVLRIRKDDNSQVLATVTNAPGTYKALSLSGGVPAGVQVGDHAAFGESGKETFDLLLTGIEPLPDLQAKLTAVPYSPAVFTAETGPIPDYDPLVSDPAGYPPQPTLYNVLNNASTGIQQNDGSFQPRIAITYGFESNGVLVTQVDAEYRVKNVDVTWRSAGRFPNNGTTYITGINGALSYEVRLRGVSAAQLPGPWATADATSQSGLSGDITALSLVEQTNVPATPNQDLSTILATATPPVDANYDHAIFDYRRLGATRWFPMVAIGDNQATAIVARDGTTYEVRARAVSASGFESQNGVTEEIDIAVFDGSVIANPDPDLTPDSALNVTGLKVRGHTPPDYNFSGKDIVLDWNAVSPPAGQTLRDYRVQIIDPATSTVLRNQYVVAPTFTYLYADNLADALVAGYTSARRTVIVKVVARTAQGKISATPASISPTNPAPTLPVGWGGPTGFFTALELRFDRPTDDDFQGTKVYASTTNGFTPGPSNLVYDGKETNPINIGGLTDGATYYVKVVLYDLFGDGPTSSQYSTTLQSLPGHDTTAPTDPGTPTLTTATSQVGQIILSSIKATWGASTDDSGALFYRVEYWTTDINQKTVDTTTNTSYGINPALAGVTYSFRVRAEDYAGNVSNWSSTVTISGAGDTTAPANVTGATATAGLDKVLLAWTNPADKDFAEVVIYRGTTSGFTANSSSEIARTPGNRLVDINITNGTAYYYKFKTVDWSGNTQAAASAAVGPVTPFTISVSNVTSYITNGAIQAAQIAAATIDASKFASGIEPVSIVSALPSPSGYTGPKTVLLTTDGKLYRYSGGAWVTGVASADISGQLTDSQLAAISAAKLTGQITTTQITDGAISTPKLAAGAVTANEIAANTITGGNIAAVTITAANIAANTITAAQIAANTITAGQIQAGAISATELATDAVTSGKVAANAITAREIAIGDLTNQVANADFEQGDVFWSKGAGWSVVNDAANARTGSWVASRTGQATQSALTPGGSAGSDPSVRCSEGDTFYARAYFRRSAAGNAGFIQLQFFDKNFSGLQTNNGNTVSGTTYAISEATGTAPAGTVWVRARPMANNTADTTYVDQVGLFRVSDSTLIKDGAITTAKIVAGAVTANEIAALTITGANIAANAIDASKIVANTITAAQIASGTITASEIAAGTITGAKLTATAIDGMTITGAVIRTSSSGARVQLDSVSGIRTLNSSSATTAQFEPSGSGFIGAGGSAISWTSSGAVTIPGGLITTGTIVGPLYKTATSGWRFELGPQASGVGEPGHPTTYIARYYQGTSSTYRFYLDQAGGIFVGGDILMNSGGNIRTGKSTASDSVNAGFWMGSNAGTPTLYIGSAGDAEYLKWDGGLSIKTSNDIRLYGNQGNGTNNVLLDISINTVGSNTYVLSIGDQATLSRGGLYAAVTGVAAAVTASNTNTGGAAIVGANTNNSVSAAGSGVIADAFAIPLTIQARGTGSISAACSIQFAGNSFGTSAPTHSASNGALLVNNSFDMFMRQGGVWKSVLIGNRGASAPSTTAAGSVTNRFGGATNFLGNPTTWFSVKGDDGNTYKIPAYS